MVRPLGVPPQLAGVEVHVAQLSLGVPHGLVVEVLRLRMAALAAGADGLRPNAVAELHHGDEAVAARAVKLLRAGPGPRAERGERAPARRGEGDGDARLGVVERLDDVPVDA